MQTRKLCPIDQPQAKIYYVHIRTYTYIHTYMNGQCPHGTNYNKEHAVQMNMTYCGSWFTLFSLMALQTENKQLSCLQLGLFIKL